MPSSTEAWQHQVKELLKERGGDGVREDDLQKLKLQGECLTHQVCKALGFKSVKRFVSTLPFVTTTQNGNVTKFRLKRGTETPSAAAAAAAAAAAGSSQQPSSSRKRKQSGAPSPAGSSFDLVDLSGDVTDDDNCVKCELVVPGAMVAVKQQHYDVDDDDDEPPRRKAYSSYIDRKGNSNSSSSYVDRKGGGSNSYSDRKGSGSSSYVDRKGGGSSSYVDRKAGGSSSYVDRKSGGSSSSYKDRKGGGSSGHNDRRGSGSSSGYRGNARTSGGSGSMIDRIGNNTYNKNNYNNSSSSGGGAWARPANNNSGRNASSSSNYNRAAAAAAAAAAQEIDVADSLLCAPPPASSTKPSIYDEGSEYLPKIPQWGLLGYLGGGGSNTNGATASRKVYLNTHDPFCLVTMGVQGVGELKIFKMLYVLLHIIYYCITYLHHVVHASS
jgi:hypothetical protein